MKGCVLLPLFNEYGNLIDNDILDQITDIGKITQSIISHLLKNGTTISEARAIGYWIVMEITMSVSEKILQEQTRMRKDNPSPNSFWASLSISKEACENDKKRS